MKARLLLLCLLSSRLLSAQIEFAPVGAEWTYNYARHEERGRERIACIGDTLIDGQSARVLSITRTYIDFSQSEDSLERVFEHKYLRQAGDTIFLYHNGAFRLIYNFAAPALNDAYIPWNESGEYYLILYTAALSDTLVNGMNARIYHINNVCSLIDLGYLRPLVVIEGIGAVNAHLFYYSDYDCNFELLPNLQNTIYHLRCYTINGELIYASEPDIDCDRLTDVPPICSCAEPEYHLAPNPATGTVSITSSDNYHPDDRIVVYAADGRKMLDQRVQENREIIDISRFSPGIYYFHFLTREGSQTQLLVVGR